MVGGRQILLRTSLRVNGVHVLSGNRTCDRFTGAPFEGAHQLLLLAISIDFCVRSM